MVHAFPPDSIGGTELHVRDLARAQAQDHEVAVFTRVRRDHLPDLKVTQDPGSAPVKVFAFNHHGRAGTSFLERTSFPAAEAAFTGVHDRMIPDVVHVHHLSGLSGGILEIAAAGGSRVVLTIHDHALACPRGQRIRLDLDPCPVLDRDRCVKCVRPSWIEAARSPDRSRAVLGLLRRGEGRRLFEMRDSRLRKQFDRVHAFLAPSQSAAELFLEFYPEGRPRMHVVPHGRAKPEPFPAADPGSRPFVAGFFGALIPSKGVGLLADVAATLDPAEIRIVMHGSAAESELSDLRARSQGRLQLAGGYPPEMLSDRMGAVHAVLVPSLWPETFSIVVREAWAHRRPVLASETGGLVEAAGPDRTRVGLLPPGDVAAWTGAIRRLATDRSWYEQLAGPHAAEPFESMLRATMACYTQAP